MQETKNKYFYRLRCIVFLVLMLCFITGCGEQELSIETVGDTSSEIQITEADTETENVSKNVEAIENVDDNTAEVESGEATLFVYVCGAVESEGVYELSTDSRIKDALEAAGGFSEDAARGYVNLAEKLHDEQRVYIPSEGDVESAEKSGDNSFDKYRRFDASGMDNPDTLGDDSVSVSRKVDINTADKAELMTLSGIGESKALDIISYREVSGGFQTIDDIKKVSGIGDATFNKIKDQITCKETE